MERRLAEARYRPNDVDSGGQAPLEVSAGLGGPLAAGVCADCGDATDTAELGSCEADLMAGSDDWLDKVLVMACGRTSGGRSTSRVWCVCPGDCRCATR
jgi:hypothetical protein